MLASQIEIQNITISNFNGSSLEITDMIMETNIFEDMFDNTLSASFVIVDAAGMLSNFPIVGQELIQLVFKTPFTRLKVVKFLAYKVENISSLSAHTMTYVLHCMSSEMAVNMLKPFSRYYEGQSSQIVQNCYNNYINSEKPLNIEESKFSVQLVVPYWTPFYLFNWLAARSISKQGNQASYVFYETMKDGFHFKSIETMLGQATAVKWIYRNSPVNPTDEFRIEKQRAQILDYEIIEAFNMIDHCINGMIGTTVYIKDLLRKNVQISTYNYIDNFNDTTHLSNFPSIPEKNATGLRYSKKYVEPKIVFGHSMMFGRGDPDSYSAWVSRRKSFVEQMRSQILKLTMAGDTDITIGNVVEIEIPDNMPATVGTSRNEILSGRYLITSIRHVISANQHLMSVEAIKDSHNFKIGTKPMIMMGAK